MRYIIEYQEWSKRWVAIMPEVKVTEFGVEYTAVTQDGAWSLDQMLDMAYAHRSSFDNWDAQMFVNGNEVLFTQIKDGDKWIRFVDGSNMKVTPSMQMKDRIEPSSLTRLETK